MAKNKIELTRNDWIEAGMKALLLGGVDSVKVDRLANAMKITRGSFYWHFKDREDLLLAIIKSWKSAQKNHIEEIKNKSKVGRDRIQYIIQYISSKDAGHDIAMRLWSYSNKTAASAVREIDGNRIKFVTQEFQKIGFALDEASFRAHTLYYFQLGDQMNLKTPTSSMRKKHFKLLDAMLVSINK